jgi:hypothetical protein
VSYTIKVVYAVYSTDQDGRNLSVIGVYSTEDKAKIAAVGKGSWGDSGNISPRNAIITDDGKCWLLDINHGTPIDVDDDFKEQQEQVKKKALQKLTPEERKALGL